MDFEETVTKLIESSDIIPTKPLPDDFVFNGDQKYAYDTLIKFITTSKPQELLLIGYAGTGKTTLMAKFINDIVINKLLTKIVITAPTHKAVSIIKSKLMCINKEICENCEIMTIHRLLNYQSKIDSDGKTHFSKSGADSNWSIYDLVIIDECSMLSNEIITDVGTELLKKTNKSLKIIFVGDPSQLPPVNQGESKIFSKNIQSIKLEKIIRTKNSSIVDLSNAHRLWIDTFDKKIPQIPKLSKYCGRDCLYYSSNDDETSVWLKKFISLINKKSIIVKKTDDETTSSVVLTWTNKKCQLYNETIRKTIFDKESLLKYELGEILIFNDYHKIIVKKELNDDDKDNDKDIVDKIEETSAHVKKDDAKHDIITFYTSEQVKLIDISLGKYKFKKFKTQIDSEIHKEIVDIILKDINKINSLLNKHVEVYFMDVQKIRSADKLCHKIMCIHSNSELKYKEIKDKFEGYMVDLKKKCYSKIDDLIFQKKNKSIYCQSNRLQILFLIEKKINDMWKEWQSNVMDKFAQLNYGYVITVHKSQGSTFKNVFIDVKDIIDNKNEKESLKCLYTAITRSSNTIHLLL